MKIYEGYSSSPDGWNVSSTLELTDDGRFSYSEGWTDYTNASLSGGAGGTWRRGDGVIFFRAESAEGPMYFPWEVGLELTATVLDGDLDFGRGWKLSPPPEHIKEIPVRNDTTKPMPLVLKPWGLGRTLAPGERVRIVTQVPRNFWEQQLKVEYGADEIVFHGSYWTWATVVPEPSPPPPAPPPQQPPAPTPKPSAEAAKPTAKPPVKPPVKSSDKPPVKPPAPSPPRARFEPRAPSPELAALLRSWVDEIPADSTANRIYRLCKEHDAIPLNGNQLEVWALRTDGQVLCIDHESFAQRAEPETDAEVAYGMIAAGAERHPELSELLPPERRGSRQSG